MQKMQDKNTCFFNESSFRQGQLKKMRLKSIKICQKEINFEKEMIEHALVKTENSKIRAAELLKISFRSLRYKVQKYNIK